jgi:hypothetical protein
MTIYSIFPVETIFEGWEESPPARTENIVLNGLNMQVEIINFHQAKVVRLNSTEPNDYLKPEWQPGRVIELSGAGK